MYQANPKKVVYLRSIIRYFPSDIIAVATTTLVATINSDFTGDDKISLIKEMGI